MTDREESLSGPPDIEYALLMRLEAGHDWPPAARGVCGRPATTRQHLIDGSGARGLRARVARAVTPAEFYRPVPGSIAAQILMVLWQSGKPMRGRDVYAAIGNRQTCGLHALVESAVLGGAVRCQRLPGTRGVWSLTPEYLAVAGNFLRTLASGAPYVPKPGGVADQVVAMLQAEGRPMSSMEITGRLGCRGRGIAPHLRLAVEHGIIRKTGSAARPMYEAVR